MIFRDILLVGGGIGDWRPVDTAAIDEETYLSSARLLGQLCSGAPEVEVEAQGLRLKVGFALPSYATSITGRIEPSGRFVVVNADEATTFSVSLVLHQAEDPTNTFDCSTIVALSEATGGSKVAAPLDERVRGLMDLRPC